MTPEEAREELMKRFPNQTVCTTTNCWFHKNLGALKTDYRITYNFNSSSLSSKEGHSFEECFETLDDDDLSIDEILKEHQILFRRFDI